MSFTFSYNGLSCAPATARLPAGPFTYSTTGTTFAFGCEIVVAAASAADLATECATLEAAFAAWDGDLIVTVDGATMISHVAASNTGFRARPTLAKAGSPDDSERSRRYTFRVTGHLPASDAGHSGGFVEEKIAVSLDAANRASVEFAGTFTAESGSTARENYAHVSTGAAARAAAWLAAFDAASDFELIRAETDEPADGKTISYRRVYRRRLIPETAAGAGSADFTVDAFTLTREIAGESAGESDAPVTFSLAFAATVNRANVDYAGLHALYSGTVKPAMLAHLDAVWLAAGDLPQHGQPILSRERTRFDTANSGIAAEWDLLVPAKRLLALDVRRELTSESRIEPRKLWDGQPHSYVLFCPGETRRARVIVRCEAVGVAVKIAPGDYPPASPPAGAKWLLVGSSVAEEAARIGQHQAASVAVFRATHTFEFLLVATPDGSAALIAPAPVLVG